MTSSSISLNVVTFSSGTGLAPEIRSDSFSFPYFCKYSFASLQSSNDARKHTSEPSRLTSSVCKANPASSESHANML